MPLNAAQRRAVDFGDGNVLVDAVPGSGKTRVIVARCLALVADGIAPSQILILTFSRRAVGELRVRLAERLAPDEMPEVRTFHGFAARLLAVAGGAGRSGRLLSEPAERSLFERTIAATHLESLRDGVVTSSLFRDAATARVAEVRLARPAALALLASRASRRVRDLLAIAAERERLRVALGVADYDDLVARAASLATTPGSAVATALRGRYRHVLVDEFQDTDPLQLDLLSALGGVVFAVGDAAQAIYGFRGAARDALDRAERTLAMTRLPLAESFRCPENVCAMARAVLQRETPPSAGTASRAVVHGASGRDAEIAFRRAASPHDEAALIGDAVAEAIAAGTPEREIAVLVRVAEPCARLVERDLRARGIAVARQGGENVLDDPAVDAIVAALEALASPTDARAWARLLGHPAFGIAPLALRLGLDRERPSGVEGVCLFLERSSLAARVPVVRIAAALRDAERLWLAGEPVRAGRAFAARADVLGFAIANDEHTIRRSANKISQFFAALADLRYVREKLGLAVSSGETFAAFVACADAWRVADDTGDEPGVRVLTVHAAKGLEFAFVVIADALDGRFPQTWRPDPLVGEIDIELARECGVDLGVLAADHDAEERSLWYVAVTRAKARLLVTWSETSLDGSPQRPSRFVPLAERAREAKCKSHRAALAYDPSRMLLDPQPRLPVALPGRPMSPSKLETWLTCRRRFYYDALLRIRSDRRGFSLQVGTLVHATIERFHAGVRDFRDVTDGAAGTWTIALHAMVRDLIARGEIETFETQLERDAALRVARRLLERYARSLERAARDAAGGFEIESIEEKVRFDVDGVSFAGTIDRIDLRGDGSHVLVDIKTGKPRDRMIASFEKLRLAVDGGTLRSKPISGNPQLPLYRHAKPETSALEYLYLGTDSKHPKPGAAPVDSASVDRLDVVANANALVAIDDVLGQTFFTPWREGTMEELKSTTVARTCAYCDFVRVCPGFLEDDE